MLFGRGSLTTEGLADDVADRGGEEKSDCPSM
jgi:hypothetical protein